MSDHIQHIWEEMQTAEEKEIALKMQSEKLQKMSPQELAVWHSSHSSSSPLEILALDEWERRRIEMQLKVARRGAWIAGVFGLAGIVLGAFLGHYLS